jgi:hypothetical protein
LFGTNELAELEVRDSVWRVQSRCKTWHVGIFRGRRGIQLRVGDLEIINGLPPGEVAPVFAAAPLKGAGVAGEIESKDMALGDVTNIDDIRRGLEGLAVLPWIMLFVPRLSLVMGRG